MVNRRETSCEDGLVVGSAVEDYMCTSERRQLITD